MKVCRKEWISRKDKTIIRENLLISNGYKIVSIWENEFDKNKIILCPLTSK